VHLVGKPKRSGPKAGEGQSVVFVQALERGGPICVHIQARDTQRETVQDNSGFAKNSKLLNGYAGVVSPGWHGLSSQIRWLFLRATA